MGQSPDALADVLSPAQAAAHARRIAAVQRCGAPGTSRVAVAREAGVSRATLYRWLQATAADGVPSPPAPRGRRPPTAADLERLRAVLVRELAQSPRRRGHDADVWTTDLLLRTISRAAGRSYTLATAERFLRSLPYLRRVRAGTVVRQRRAPAHWIVLTHEGGPERR